VVLGLHVQADLLALVLAGKGGDLGGVEGGNLAGNDLRGLDVEVNIINAELFVEPADLVLDQRLGDPATAQDDILDCYKLEVLASSGAARYVPAFICSTLPVNSGAT
jgi:hypothetical protein